MFGDNDVVSAVSSSVDDDAVAYCMAAAAACMDSHYRQ